MKILYKQPQTSTGSLGRFGISNCYLKTIMFNRDRGVISKRQHQHRDFEIHIVREGYQQYAVGDKVYRIEKGDFLLIWPNASHQALDAAANTQKYAITFHLPANNVTDHYFGAVTARMEDSMEFICQELNLHKDISDTLIENALLELIVRMLRMAGLKEKERPETQEENATIAFAKQYIADNIERFPSVTDVAEYCHLSNKQLTRIFQGDEGVCPGEYIIRQRIHAIENLLRDGSLSLRQISEQMHFASEHYFNAFFKKYAGMPPGEYRKMQGK